MSAVLFLFDLLLNMLKQKHYLLFKNHKNHENADTHTDFS